MSYRKPMSFWTFNFLGISTYDSIMIFMLNILVDYQDGLLSLGPVGPWGGWGHNFKNVCTIQHPWFYPDFCAKHLGEFSSLIVVFGPNAQLLKCVNNSTFLILSWFLCQTIRGVIELDCCLWALGGEGVIAQILKCLYTSTFFILSWFCAKHFGECSNWIVVFGPCGGKGTIFKMYLQFNIPDFIFIFVPNILGSYLSLRMRPLDRAIFGPCWAQRGEGHNF